METRESRPTAEAPTHLLYIDDSGTKEYAADPRAYSSGGNTKYFVFGAVLLAVAEASRLVTKIRSEKLRVFRARDVEIKSNWLRIPWERERRYLQPYGLDEKGLLDFVESFYGVIAAADLRLIAAVVNKAQMQEQYQSPWYAPAVAYELLLQRAVQEVARPGSLAVTVDDMTGATPKGTQYKKNLARHHRQLRRNGSRLRAGLDFSPLGGDLRFLNSAHSDQIQVADVVAYNVYRQFVEHGDDWELLDSTGSPQPVTSATTLPTYPYFMRLAGKFRTGPNKRVQGYGIAKLPMIRRIPWRYEEDDE
jgi:hypothetical protein